MNMKHAAAPGSGAMIPWYRGRCRLSCPKSSSNEHCAADGSVRKDEGTLPITKARKLPRVLNDRRNGDVDGFCKSLVNVLKKLASTMFLPSPARLSAMGFFAVQEFFP
jgi:hypothetical protein